MSLPSSRGRSTNTLLAVVLLLLVALSVYSLVELSATQSQIASLQQQNAALRNDIFRLQNDISSLQAQINSLSQGKAPVADFQVAYACLSLTGGCYGLDYYVIVNDKGNTSVPKGYGIYLSFKDSTKSTYFGFNTSLPQDLTPNQGVTIEASSWPAGSGAEGKLSQGDQVGVAVVIGQVQAAIGTYVLTCNQYTTTTTFLNYTRTQTTTLTTQNCV